MVKSQVLPELNFTAKTRKKVRIFFRDKFKCLYCNSIHTDYKQLTVDHVVPKSLGGNNDYNNLATCCKKCNQKKGSLILTEFLNRYNIKVTKRIAKYL